MIINYCIPDYYKIDLFSGTDLKLGNK